MKNPNQNESLNENEENQKKIAYPAIIKQAFALTREKKFLWIWGFFLALTSGLGGGFYGDYEGLTEIKKEIVTHSELKPFYDSLINFGRDNLTFLVSLGVIIFLLAISFFILRVISQGALIAGIYKTKLASAINFKSAFKKGLYFFWRLLGLQLFTTGIIIFSLIILALPIIFLASSLNPWLIFLIFIGFIIFFFIILIVSIINLLALLFIVCSDQRVFVAVESSYDLLTKNWKRIVTVFFLNFILGLIFNFGLGILAFIFIIIGGVITVLFYFISGIIGSLITGSFLLILLLIASIFLRGIFTVFLNTIWVIFFNEIAGQKIDRDKETVTEKKPAKIIA